MRASAAFLCILSALAAVPASAQTLVYRVDQATAVIDGSHLVVTAKGAVRSGGWEHPRLVLRKGGHEPGDIEIDFTATPPENSSVVIQSLLPVNVTLRTRLPRSGVAAVKVVSQTNSVTAEIIPKYEKKTRTAGR
jgi:hypothetical protein